jgi:dienelactone hydrolase
VRRYTGTSIFVGALSVVYLFSTQQALDGEKIAYPGYNPQSVAEIYTGDWAIDPVALDGILYLPEGEGPFPVVLLQHGNGGREGLQQWWDVIIPALLDAGIGGFVGDSWAGRGLGRTNPEKMTFAARITDVFMALDALSKHPRVDPARIGISGYSFGGGLAITAAYDRVAHSIVGEGVRFAAHFPVYPNCLHRFENASMTGAPIHMLLGESDNQTPPNYCISLAADLQDSGSPVTYEIYPEVGHGFVKATGRIQEGRVNVDGCGTWRIKDNGHIVANGVESQNRTYASFVKALTQFCGERANLESYGTRASQDRARDDTVAFFKKHLRRKVFSGPTS